jgi:hypothetical protein
MQAMHKMGAVRVWRGDGDESKDQGEAFDKWAEVLWTNLAKLEAASKGEEDFSSPSYAGRDINDEYADDDEEDDEDEDDEEPLVRCFVIPLLLIFLTNCRLTWKIWAQLCKKELLLIRISQ